MRFFDTHTHVNFSDFKSETDATIKRALDAKTWLINVGTGLKASRECVDLAKKYPEGVFASIGQHPTESESFEEEVYETLLSDKVVAIGECGLGYYRIPKDSNQETVISKQKKEFIKQIQFAKKYGLPLIIHCRDAYEDLLAILKSEYAGLPAVAHSFTETWETAKKILDQGLYIALNGILTFDKSGKLAKVVEKMPFEKLLIETDAPFLAPPPHRGKRNEPAFVQYVAEKIAAIKKMSVEEVGEQTFANACKLFQIKNPDQIT